MNALKFQLQLESFSYPHSPSRKLVKRAISILLTVALLVSLGMLVMKQESKAEAAPSSGELSRWLRRVGTQLRAALSFSPAVVQGGGQGPMLISTIAGGGFGTNVPAIEAPMQLPSAVALDPQGRGFYVVDYANETALLRFVNTTSIPVTLAGVTIQPNNINLIAGGGLITQNLNGNPPRDVDLGQITGLSVDPTGNAVYICSPTYSAIFAINVGTQNLTVLNQTVAPGTIAAIFSPTPSGILALTLDPATGSFYYLAGAPRVVYRLEASGTQSVYAGGGNPSEGNGDGGQATQARLVSPLGLAVEPNGNLLIAEGGDTRNTPGAVRKVEPNGVISSLISGLAYPVGITRAPDGSLYVALGNSQQIIRASSGQAIAGTALSACDQTSNPSCGDGGLATSAFLNIPGSTSTFTQAVVMAADANGIYLPDVDYRRVRYINLSNNSLTIAGRNIGAKNIHSVAGSGLLAPYDNTAAISAELIAPTGVAEDASGNLFIAEPNKERVRFVNRGTTPVTLFAGTAWARTVQPGQIVTLNDAPGASPQDGRISTKDFDAPQGLAVTANGIFIADSRGGKKFSNTLGSSGAAESGSIYFLNTSSNPVTLFPNGAARTEVPPGVVMKIAGVTGVQSSTFDLNDGSPANQAPVFPTDIAVDAAGNIYIADKGIRTGIGTPVVRIPSRIRKIDASTGIINTLSAVLSDGTSGPLTTDLGTGVAVDSAGRLYVADTGNNRVLRQDVAGGMNFTIIANSSMGLNKPRDITVDSLGRVWVTNTGTHQVLRIDAPQNQLGTVAVVAGTGVAGFSGDGGRADLARLNLISPIPQDFNSQVTANIITLANDDIVFTDTYNGRIRLLVRLTNQPPVLSAINDQTMNEGTSLTLDFTATDPNSDQLSFSIANRPGFGTFTDNGNSTASLQLTPGFSDAGTYTITVTVTDGELSDSKTFTLTVNDVNRPPIVSAGTINSPVEATSAGGASVQLSGSASDPDGDTLTLRWFDGAAEIASSATANVTLSIGTHSIFLMATDSKGASASSTAQTVVVQDTTPPVISGVPANLTVEATSANGATVSYTMPTATDLVDGNVPVTTSRPSGSLFPIGATVVTFTAKDARNNTATASFTVTVRDTTPPVISGVPANLTVEATSASGAAVNYAMPTAADIVDGNVVVSASRASGSVFPLGTTTVTFTATDSRGNSATASFSITVRDTTPPTISNVPGNITTPKTSASGATVSYTMPTATDLVDGNVPVTTSHPSGSLFPIGTTTVTFTAKDSRNNTATASFTITVLDREGPVISGVPSDIVAEATSPNGAVVNYTMPTANDAVQGAVPVTASHPPGSLFPLGTTTVTFTATNDVGVTSTTSFKVTVRDTTPPLINGIPGNQVFEGDTPGGKVFTFSVTATDLVDGSVAVNVSGIPANNLYPVGVTTVTLMATDSRGNKAVASFTVTVTDTRGPVISGVPANISVNSTSPQGAVVNYTMPTAIDTVEGPVPVIADKAPGTLFPIGTTTVTFTAMDSRGNTTTASFQVTVTPEPTYTIRTVAGNGNYGYSGDGGLATDATFRSIAALSFDKDGRLLIVDGDSRVVRRLESNGTITTVAGNSSAGNGGDNKAATSASFGLPAGVAADGFGNIYVADAFYHRIRKVTPDGKIQHFAGEMNGVAGFTGDGGQASKARLRGPTHLVVDRTRNYLYVADTGNHRIRRIDLGTGVIVSVAGNGAGSYSGDGGAAVSAGLNTPLGLAVDGEGNLYIADAGNHRIRKVSFSDGKIVTVVGTGSAGYGGDDGPAIGGVLNMPGGVGVDQEGNLLIADTGNHVVRRVSVLSGKITTVAGKGVPGYGGDDGPAVEALLMLPAALVVAEDGSVYEGETGNRRVRKLIPSGGAQVANRAPVITSTIGNQAVVVGQVLEIALSATDEDGDGVTFMLMNAPPFVTIVEANPAQRTAKLRIAPTAAGTFNGVQVKADDGKGGTATSDPFTITVNELPAENRPPVATAGPLPATIEATSAAGAMVNLSGSGTDPDGDPLSFTWRDNGTVIATSATASVTLGIGNHSIALTVADGRGGTSTTPAQTVIVQDTTPPVISNIPANMTVAATSPAGAVVNYSPPTATDLVDGTVPVVADKALGSTFPVGTTTVKFTATDSRGNQAMATFSVTVTPFAGGGEISYTIRTVAGNGNYGYSGDGGPATDATFRSIAALSFDKDGRLLIVDGDSRVVRRLESNGTITTVAGNSSAGNGGDNKAATAASFGLPAGVAADAFGNIYVADAFYHRIRKVTPDGKIQHFAGEMNGVAGFTGDGGQASKARLRGPTHLVVDRTRNYLYIADTGNHRIRRIDLGTGVIVSVAGNGAGSYGGDGGAAVSAGLNTPLGLAVDGEGNLYIADAGNHRIRKVSFSDGKIVTVVGTGSAGYGGDDGPAIGGVLNMPGGVGVDQEGNLLIADTGNHVVRRVSVLSGKITTVAGKGVPGYGGDDGPAVEALLMLPAALVVAEDGSVYEGETGNRRVRKLIPSGGSPPPANRPPLAVANTLPSTIDASSPSGVTVNLDGSASSDPDGDTLTYEWSDNGIVFATTVTATRLLSIGTHTITLTVRDGRGGTSNTSQTVTVRDASSSVAPVLKSIDPNSGRRGKTFVMTLSGEDFQPSATVTFSTGDVTATEVVVRSSTEMTAKVTVAANALVTTSAFTRRSVTVKNPNGKTSTLSLAFAVLP